jgi:Type II secretion system (T2SS), protein M subtype b
MNLSPRDRRALAILGVAVLLGLVYEFWPSSNVLKVVAPSTGSVALVEKRLEKMRETAATVPAKEAILKQVSADLAARENGLIKADTAAQAQAQLIQIFRRIGSAENPPLEVRNTEIGPVRPLGDAYGEVLVSVQTECRIDQLVNVLAAIPAQPELIASSDLRVMSSNAKEKTVGVRLTLSGVVPRRLVPAKAKVGATL